MAIAGWTLSEKACFDDGEEIEIEYSFGEPVDLDEIDSMEEGVGIDMKATIFCVALP